MTTPGVGAIVALTFVSAIDDPARFRSSRMVGAHFGLTPRKHQSGETDVTGRISRIGDHGVRVALYEAANVILTRAVTGSDLKSWALGRRPTRRDEKGQGGPGPQVGGRAPPHAGRRHNLHGQQGSPISGCGRLGSTGGNEGSGGLGTSPVRKQVPSPGRWIRSGRICGSSGSPTARPEIGRPVLIRPYQAAATRGLRTEASPWRPGPCSRGIDTTRPVTEARISPPPMFRTCPFLIIAIAS